MKFTKRLLAVLLTLALALALAVPAFAAVDWDDFYIITQPVRSGEGWYTLSVEVNVPDGVDVEYQWYCYGRAVKGATESIFVCSPNDYPGGVIAADSFTYTCSITGYEKDGDEIVSEKTLTSHGVVVRFEVTKWQSLLRLLVLPLKGGVAAAMGGFFLFSPLYFLIGYIFMFIAVINDGI